MALKILDHEFIYGMANSNNTASIHVLQKSRLHYIETFFWWYTAYMA